MRAFRGLGRGGPAATLKLIALLTGTLGAMPGAVVANANIATPKPTLTIYVYDSFVAKGGLGPEIFPLFEKRCGCEVKILPSGDGGQLLTRLQLDAERGKSSAQVALGLDEQTFDRAKPWLDDSFDKLPHGYRDLHPDIKRTPGFYPFDYGFFAFMADHQALSEANLSMPKKLTDLLAPQWKRQVILEDPRTSTPGLAFVLYANQVSGMSEKEFWPKMRTQWLTLAAGWDSAYGLFLRKEAPLVWSYTTSQAYHEAHESLAPSKSSNSGRRRYEAVLFEEGQPIQVEGAALIKNAFGTDEQGKKQRELANQFLEFLISSEVQKLIPTHQWMYPARKSTPLPASFSHVPRPKKVVQLKAKASDVSSQLSAWSRAVEGAL